MDKPDNAFHRSIIPYLVSAGKSAGQERNSSFMLAGRGLQEGFATTAVGFPPLWRNPISISPTPGTASCLGRAFPFSTHQGPGHLGRRIPGCRRTVSGVLSGPNCPCESPAPDFGKALLLGHLLWIGCESIMYAALSLAVCGRAFDQAFLQKAALCRKAIMWRLRATSILVRPAANHKDVFQSLVYLPMKTWSQSSAIEIMANQEG
jgi:hypothetical protein